MLHTVSPQFGEPPLRLMESHNTSRPGETFCATLQLYRFSRFVHFSQVCLLNVYCAFTPLKKIFSCHQALIRWSYGP